MSGETAPVTEVAERHRFDVGNLERFLTGKIEPFDRLTVKQFQGGASNPTFLVTGESKDGERRYVLRKKPPGQLLASAHQVDREYKVMKALDGQIPVPKMRALCTDDDVIGTYFYVMDYLPGRIFRDATLPDQTPAERAAIYDELNSTLAKLHQVDFEKVGLGDYGKPGGYFERQVGRWTKQYRGAETEHIPAMEKLIEELPKRIPKDDSVVIAHGDYRLENVMFHPTEPKLIAVLDWELSTLGHPMADIAYNGFLWHSTGTGWGSLVGVDFETSGIPTEKEYVRKYMERTGRSEIGDWPFYMAFSVFRLASIGQGVYKRVLAGVAPSDRPAINGTAAMAEQALELLNRPNWID